MNTIDSISTQIIARLPGNEAVVLKERHEPGKELQQQKALDELRQTDAEVRNHEREHVQQAAGNVVSGPQYKYVIGPDGKAYAVGAEVRVDLSPVPGNPEATMRKAEALRKAALSPGDPSSQDLAVAMAASQLGLKAAQQVKEEARQDDNKPLENIYEKKNINDSYLFGKNTEQTQEAYTHDLEISA